MLGMVVQAPVVPGGSSSAVLLRLLSSSVMHAGRTSDVMLRPVRPFFRPVRNAKAQLC